MIQQKTQKTLKHRCIGRYKTIEDANKAGFVPLDSEIAKYKGFELREITSVRGQRALRAQIADPKVHFAVYDWRGRPRPNLEPVARTLQGTLKKEYGIARRIIIEDGQAELGETVVPLYEQGQREFVAKQFRHDVDEFFVALVASVHKVKAKSRLHVEHAISGEQSEVF